MHDVEPSSHRMDPKLLSLFQPDGNYEIYQKNADGTDPVRLTENIMMTIAPCGHRIEPNCFLFQPIEIRNILINPKEHKLLI